MDYEHNQYQLHFPAENRGFCDSHEGRNAWISLFWREKDARWEIRNPIDEIRKKLETRSSKKVDTPRV